jgi:hypothetical protein
MPNIAQVYMLPQYLQKRKQIHGTGHGGVGRLVWRSGLDR